MQNKGCITCRKSEQVGLNFYCGKKRLTQKQLYNQNGYCTKYEPIEKQSPTNEEWLRSASTEKLIQELAIKTENIVRDRYLSLRTFNDFKRFWESWLKEKHET